MNHVDFALAHPVFDPDRDMRQGHFWRSGKFGFGLTANVGME